MWFFSGFPSNRYTFWHLVVSPHTNYDINFPHTVFIVFVTTLFIKQLIKLLVPIFPIFVSDGSA